MAAITATLADTEAPIAVEMAGRGQLGCPQDGLDLAGTFGDPALSATAAQRGGDLRDRQTTT
jgi:hypothetical protein